MIYRFRHGIIGPLAIFWLIVTVASVVMGAVAWSRFSRSIDASAEAEQLRESINQLFLLLLVPTIWAAVRDIFSDRPWLHP